MMRMLLSILAVGLLSGCQTTGGAKGEVQAYCPKWPEWPSDLSKPKIVKSAPCSGQGYACLAAQIDEAGNVTDVQVVRTDSADYGLACAAVLKRWHFEPARRGSTPVAVTYFLFVRGVAQ